MAAFAPEAILAALTARQLIPPGSAAQLRLLHDTDGKTSHRIDPGEAPLFVKQGAPHWSQVEADIQAAVAAVLPDWTLPVLARLPEINGFAMPFVPPDQAAPWGNTRRRLDPRVLELTGMVADRLGRFHALTAGSARLEQAAEANRDRIVGMRQSFLWHSVLLAPETASAVRRAFGSFARRTALTHGDIGFGNILTRREGVLLIDFEKAWYGDPAFDCGWMLAALIRAAIRTREPALRGLLPDAVRRAGRSWSAHVTWEDRDRAEVRAVRIALVRCVASHHDVLDRIGKPVPPAIARDIDGIVRLVCAEPMGVAELAERLAAGGFAPADA